MKMSPPDGASSPDTIDSSVLLPQPDEPTTAMNSPRSTSSETLESASVSRSGVKECSVAARIATAGGALPDGASISASSFARELLLRLLGIDVGDDLVVVDLLVGRQHAADHHDLLRLG